jgi:hypothetical protein
MVESVSQTEAYQEFEKRNNRFLNMLTDNVREKTTDCVLYRIETLEDKDWMVSRSL